MKKILIAIAIVWTAAIAARAGTVPPDSTIFPGLTGKQLIDSVRVSYRPFRTLPYAGTPDVRDTIFGEIDLTASDSVTCVYSTFTIYMQPGQDPDDWSYSHGLNTEHTWPQSYLNTSQSPNPTGDMNHLFPTDIEVNSSRGSWPFAEIPDSQTETWYYNNTTTSSVPSSNIDLYAEYGSNTFEPREQQKGNTARAMYYMLTMYQLPDTTLAWWTGQKNLLYTWHCNDPANAAEIARTRMIALHQSGKANPFILDSTLIRRAFFPGVSTTSVCFASASAVKTEGDVPFNIGVSISNPSDSTATSVQVVLAGGTGAAADVDNYSAQALTFPAGSSASQNVAIAITDDALEEGTETLVFKLRNVSGGNSAAIGADSVFTLTLNDNDAVGGYAVVISEVNEQRSSLPSYFNEYVELFNNTAVPVNLNGWQLKQDNTAYVTTFGSGDTIKAMEYFVIARSSSGNWSNYYSLPYNVVGSLVLNGSETFSLRDAGNNLVDSTITFASSYYCQYRTRPFADGTLSASWYGDLANGTSATYGTPGGSNPNDPLGVELACLSALGEPGRVSLKWTTSSEFSSWQWRIFSSTDSSSGYRHRTSLPTAGTTNEVYQYQWTDFEAVVGAGCYYRLVEMDISGDSVVYGPVSAAALPVTGRGQPRWVSCSPNPFRQTISVSCRLVQPGNARLDIYNVFGQKVRSLSRWCGAGLNTFAWDGKNNAGQNCPAGVYILRLAAGDKVHNGKITLVK